MKITTIKMSITVKFPRVISCQVGEVLQPDDRYVSPPASGTAHKTWLPWPARRRREAEAFGSANLLDGFKYVQCRRRCLLITKIQNISKLYSIYGGVPNIRVPPNHPFNNRIFNYKPSILRGTPILKILGRTRLNMCFKDSTIIVEIPIVAGYLHWFQQKMRS